ncbi:MAG: TonB-dependent receptor [Halieaceae bacterium]|jgi:iron complex outermembrane recepter protein|nr:TonB-dependent receptor [Halieaceae bacterium]
MKKFIPTLGATLLLPLFSPATLAQTGSQEALILEEILVTATRRTERLQDVPMSVSAFGSDFLQDSGINDLTNLDEYTPNLKITPGQGTPATSFRIRGIGSVGTNSGIDPSVGIFLDGVYQGRAGMSIGDLVDVERVEVLRGPQGTLYGKNTAAGALSVITKHPASEFESMLEMSYDTNELMELRGMVNLPLGESGHAVRLSGFNADGDYLYENTYKGEGLNDENKWGGRARFLFDMKGKGGNEGLGEFLVTLDYTKEDKDCCALAIIDYEGLSPLNTPSTNNPSAEWQTNLGLNDLGRPVLQYTAFEDSEGFSPPSPDPFGDDYWLNGDVYSKVKVGGVAVEWNRMVANNNALTFINAWRFYEADTSHDGDLTAYEASGATDEVDLNQFSSELRLASPSGQKFEGQVGLYAYYSDMDSVGTLAQGQALYENALIRVEGTTIDLPMSFLFPEGSVNTDDNNYNTTSFAAFGQLIWNINEEFSATLGMRYTYEKKEREGSQTSDPVPQIGDLPPVDLPPIAGPDIEYDSEHSDSDISPSFNLRYFYSPDIMGYASVSRGFKSGGFDQRRVQEGDDGEFDEEIATSYELGWKTTLFDRRLKFNGTLFLVDYEDFQSESFDGAQVRVTNAGDLRSYGTELELVFIPMANMTIGSAVGYVVAEYESFENGQCTIDQIFTKYYIVDGAQFGSPGTQSVCKLDLSGEPLDNAPQWTVSSYIQYDFNMGEDLLGIARLEHNFIDKFYLDQDLDENLANDQVNLVNFRLSLRNQARDWDVSVWGRNILDEEYYSHGIDIPVMGGYAGFVAPRSTYGITLRLYH